MLCLLNIRVVRRCDEAHVGCTHRVDAECSSLTPSRGSVPSTVVCRAEARETDFFGRLQGEAKNEFYPSRGNSCQAPKTLTPPPNLRSVTESF
jgi:hypothetical protein